jgi:hypothetical protein
MMGAWGEGLYDDDFAADLKSNIALIAKVPKSGEALLDILLGIHGKLDPDELDHSTFSLVVADQFERRGIACPRAFETALAVLNAGTNLQQLKELDMEQRSLDKRAVVLAELATRLRNPRPTRPRSTPKNPPAFVVAVGEVYIYPTMKGMAVNAWMSSWQQVSFVPNGWGAFIVLDVGRAYGWLPWCAIAALSTDASQPATMDAVLHSQLMLHPQTRGAARCVPKKSHLALMQAQRIGQLILDPSTAKASVSKWSVNQAIECGWSVCSASFSANINSTLPRGLTVSELLQP